MLVISKNTCILTRIIFFVYFTYKILISLHESIDGNLDIIDNLCVSD